MVEKLGIYKCGPCNVIAEALTDGQGVLICCCKPMEKLVAKTVDEGKEKHVPVLTPVATFEGMQVLRLPRLA